MINKSEKDAFVSLTFYISYTYKNDSIKFYYQLIQILNTIIEYMWSDDTKKNYLKILSNLKFKKDWSF